MAAAVSFLIINKYTICVSVYLCNVLDNVARKLNYIYLWDSNFLAMESHLHSHLDTIVLDGPRVEVSFLILGYLDTLICPFFLCTFNFFQRFLNKFDFSSFPYNTFVLFAIKNLFTTDDWIGDSFTRKFDMLRLAEQTFKASREESWNFRWSYDFKRFCTSKLIKLETKSWENSNDSVFEQKSCFNVFKAKNNEK